MLKTPMVAPSSSVDLMRLTMREKFHGSTSALLPTGKSLLTGIIIFNTVEEGLDYLFYVGPATVSLLYSPHMFTTLHIFLLQIHRQGPYFSYCTKSLFSLIMQI